jgi:hypothetical protein
VDPQRQVGPYRLIERLGRGGMGEVWLAEDPTGAAGGAPRRVALKLLDPAMVDDPDARARFAREVVAARRVRGACVAALLDADVDAPQPWLASAYVAGATLAEHVARHGPLGDSALRALGAALAEALASIHAVGVVHRDLTPRNVVLGPDGPRVVDFGIAWYPDAPDITQAGAWVGTPAWMPPERLAGGAVTAAGDVWSWGAVMAFAARGGLPGRDDPAATTPAGVGAVDVTSLPAWLAGTVRMAMSPEPSARPTTDQLGEAMTFGRAAPLDETLSAGGAPTETRPYEPTRVQGGVPPIATGGATDTGVGSGAGAAPTAGRGGGPGSRGERRQVARWISALSVLGLAVVVGYYAPLLVTIMVVAVLLVVAVGLRLGRERLPEGARPVPPTWAVALAGPAALGVGLAQVLGPLGGAAALLGLIVLFVLVGGDIG